MSESHVFRGELYHWRDDKASWVFVDVPQHTSDEIADLADAAGPRRGFGSVKVRARIGDAVWETSLFPSSTQGCYVLPVKKPVRRAAGVDAGDEVTVEVTLLPGAS